MAKPLIDVPATARDLEYRADIDRALGDLRPLYDRLKSRGKVPHSATVRKLTDEYVKDSHTLHMASFPCEPDMAYARLKGQCAEYNYCRETPAVLMLDESLIGLFLIFSPKESRAFIYGVAIAEKWRGTWANVLLKYEALAHLRRRGVLTVDFRASYTSADTRKHAARVGAQVLSD